MDFFWYVGGAGSGNPRFSDFSANAFVWRICGRDERHAYVL
jgi:hypothetical protein